MNLQKKRIPASVYKKARQPAELPLPIYGSLSVFHLVSNQGQLHIRGQNIRITVRDPRNTIISVRICNHKHARVGTLQDTLPGHDLFPSFVCSNNDVFSKVFLQATLNIIQCMFTCHNTTLSHH